MTVKSALATFIISFALIFCAVSAVVIYHNHLQHWAAIHTGTLNEAGPYYGFWSGFGSDFGEVTLITAVGAGMVTAYRIRECHNKTCHWPAQFTSADGNRLCHKCKGKPHHELSLHFIHPHHSLTSRERDAVGITAENQEATTAPGIQPNREIQMQELLESEVQEVVVTGSLPEGLVEIEGKVYSVDEKGILTPLEVKDPTNDPYADSKSINAWQRRAMEILAGSRVSPHAAGRAPRELVMAKRRKRAKAAKASRRRNR